MFLDARRIDDESELAADVCVVGAGAAGITMARALSGTGLKVLVLESGGLTLDQRTQVLNAGDSVGQPYGVVNNRLRFFGGTTNHWRGWCRPLDEIDFEPRDWVPRSGWPIRRSDLDRYYDAARGVCQLAHSSFDARDWARMTGTSAFPASAEIASTVFQVSPPTRFGKVYRAELERSRSVTVLLHANVVRVQLAEGGREVRSLRVATLSGRRFAVRARRFVLAAGGLENARLLLASSDVQRTGVGNQHDLVGRFFADHPHVPVGSIRYPVDPRASAFYGVHPNAEHPRAEAGLVATDLFVRRERLLRSYIASIDLPSGASLDRQVRAVGRDLAGADFGLPRLLSLRTEQAPNPDSRLTLEGRRDELGVPLVRLDWRIGEFERRSAARTMAAVASTLGAGGHARVYNRLLVDEERAWHETVGGSHHMGTVRMASDPRDGVVDASCRVHGVSNLYVAGSAVFATTGFANPTFTIVALALRLADHLKASFA